MDDCCLSGFVEAVQVWHSRIERKERVEGQRRGCAVSHKGVFAAQALPIPVAHRHNGSETIKRSAKHDHQKTRIPAFGQRHARQVGPGKQRARSQQKFAAIELMDHDITCVGIRKTSEEGPRLVIYFPREPMPLWFRTRAGDRRYSARWPPDRAYPRRAAKSGWRYRGVERGRPSTPRYCRKTRWVRARATEVRPTDFVPAGSVSHRVV